jgi:hypothetical protein
MLNAILGELLLCPRRLVMCPNFYVHKARHMVRLCYAIVYSWLALGLMVSGCVAQDAPPYVPAPIAGDPAADGRTYWPVALEATEGRVEIYQPQPEATKGNTVTARAAVSLTRPGASAPVFGVAWFSAVVVTDRDTRMVTVRQVTVKNIRLPGSSAAEQQDFASAIGGRLSAMMVTFPLDQLMASLDTAQQEHIEAAHISTTPPRILFSTTPTTLISVNGGPHLAPVEGHSGVSRVANTPFIVLVDDASQRYYLKAGARWVSAPELTGSWADTASVPPEVAAAGADLATPAPQPGGAAGSAAAGAPAAPTAVEISPAAADAKIIVTTEPTELLVTDGNPQFTPVPGGGGGELLYASNTASDLFLDQADQRYYVLLSGRWYAAASLQGSWQYVASDKLPPAFGQIPADSPKADVLSFIAGTAEGRDAVLDAGIPQTAVIRRDAGTDLTVAYDGDPQFQDVSESPGVAYARNTPEDVLRVNGLYYCCHQAVWYESALPTGPWTVSVSVPPVIYTLPPSCPDYNVQYVSVYDYTPDYVTCGYLPGYTGTFVYGSTIVYGTGYVYPGWYGTAYFPPLCTWGYAAYYDPFACAWGFDVGLYWGGFGWFAHPWHQRWWRDHPDERWGSHKWWGPAGFVHSHDIRGHLMDARAGGAFRMGERGGSLAARMPGADRREPGWNNLYAREGNAGRNIPAAQLRSFTEARVAAGSRNDVYAGNDGRVFRQSDAGWEEYNSSGRSWSGMDRVPYAQPEYGPAPGAARYRSGFSRPDTGLDRDFDARSRGDFRSSTIHSFGGGGSRGGGGRR